MKLEKLAKSYDFETVDEFFDYIIDSYYNGHRAQVKSLYMEMATNADRSRFVDYLYEMATDEAREAILEIIGLNR
jgi:iron-sulfur cluster repair protein YtfE (RIC family)